MAGEEIEKVRHHLQIGWHVRVVAEEVHVVESDLDHMLDAIAEMAAVRRRITCRGRPGGRGQPGGGGCRHAERAQEGRAPRRGGDPQTPPPSTNPPTLPVWMPHPLLLLGPIIRPRGRTFQPVTLWELTKLQATGRQRTDQPFPAPGPALQPEPCSC